jgi:hypothetical protein
MGFIKDYTPAAKANEYAGPVAQLVEAGEGAAWDIDIAVDPKADEKTNRRAVEVQVRAFQKAAADAGKTARQDKRTDTETNVNIVFVLVPKIVRPAKPAADADGVALDGVDVEDVKA